VVVDLRNRQRDFFTQLGIPFVPDEWLGPNILILQRYYAAIEKVRTVLSEDERIYADYRRHTVAHPIQKSYSLRWNHRHGQVNRNHRVPANDREYTVEELDLAIKRILKACPDETAIAINFAQRMRHTAHELELAAQPCFSL